MPKITDPAILAQVSGRPSGVQVKPADPKLPGEVRGIDLRNQQTAQQMGIAAAMLPAELAKARAQAATAQADIGRTALERQRLTAEQSRGGLTAEQFQAQKDKLASLRALQSQIGRVSDLYKRGPGATKGVSGLLDYLPTPQNGAFNAAASGIGDVAFNAFRTPGAGAQSDAELKARLAATQPSASDYDATIEEKLGYLQTRLSEAYKALGVPYEPIQFGQPQSAQAKPANDGWEIVRRK